jgi:mRNA-degrading endonuclease RelE of RelBE toxin-antitoxin system
MTTKDIKAEIQKSLDRVPESVLQDILDFLKQVENQPIEKVNLTRNLRDILSEDKELLERLAK